MALTLFFCVLQSSRAMSAQEEMDATMSGYITRMALALAILALAGYLAVKFVPGRFRQGGHGKARLITALNLGRDMVYIIQVGPDVIAIFSGKSGVVLMGRWSLNEWDSLEDESEGGKI